MTLTYTFINAMKRRNCGAIVFLSSMAGTMPIPFMAAYSATKAFPLFMAESLYDELAQTNIDVIAVVPGNTSTEFRETAGLNNKFPIPPRTADDVVETTFNALGKIPSVIDGTANKISAFAMARLPKKNADQKQCEIVAGRKGLAAILCREYRPSPYIGVAPRPIRGDQ